MNNLTVTQNKTPIEIALGIDEEGMTTARNLYEFLELRKGDYSRWLKSNIIDNQFADENVDYFPFRINADCGGQASKDAKLTAHFAKKLSMQGKGEKGEQAREYFTRLEEKNKEMVISRNTLSPELRLFFQMGETMAKYELEQKCQAEKMEQIDSKMESIKEVVALSPTQWRKDSASIINKIALKLGGYEHIRPVREEVYKLLEQRMGVALGIRLTNRKKTMALNGVCKSKIDKLNQLDVIADDKKLIEGYIAIVKEMAIKYGAV